MVRDLIRPNLKPMFLYNTIADFQYAFNDCNNFEKINIYNSIKEKEMEPSNTTITCHLLCNKTPCITKILYFFLFALSCQETDCHIASSIHNTWFSCKILYFRSVP